MTDFASYDELDMHGLDRAWYESTIPAEAQARLIQAFPELRIIWNGKHSMFQLVHRDERGREPFYGGCEMMVGWAIIPGNYAPPLDIDEVIKQCRAREALAKEQAYDKGFKTFAEYVDHLTDEVIAKQKKEASEKMDDLLGIDSERKILRPFYPGQVRVGYGGWSKDSFKGLPPIPDDLRGAAVMEATRPRRKRRPKGMR